MNYENVIMLSGLKKFEYSRIDQTRKIKQSDLSLSTCAEASKGEGTHVSRK